MTTPESTEKRKQRRFLPVLWATSALAALALVLGVNGTLASWTQAIVTNDTNTTQSAASVSLQESDSNGVKCVDTASTSDNTAICATLNKYGGTATPLKPGDTVNVTVKLKNTGTGSGALTLTPDVCSSTKVAGTNADPATYPLCSKATVAVKCTAPGTLDMAATTLATFSGAKTVGTLASGEETACTFTVALPSDTPAGYANQIAAQQLVWKLTAA